MKHSEGCLIITHRVPVGEGDYPYSINFVYRKAENRRHLSTTLLLLPLIYTEEAGFAQRGGVKHDRINFKRYYMFLGPYRI